MTETKATDDVSAADEAEAVPVQGRVALEAVLARTRQYLASQEHRDLVKRFAASQPPRRLPPPASRGIPDHERVRGPAMRPQHTPAISAAARAVQWSRTHRRGMLLVLSGPSYCGKSVALASSVWHSPEPARFIFAEEVGAIADSAFSETKALRDALVRVPLLAIDEAWRERGREAAWRLASLLQRRYNDGRRTLVASNLTIEAFTETYLVDPNGDVSSAMESRLEEQKADGCRWWVELRPLALKRPATRR